jgi:hypothetical protein
MIITDPPPVSLNITAPFTESRRFIHPPQTLILRPRTMHRALQISEILSYIIEELPVGQEFCLVTINKQWTEVALRILWKDINDIDILLSILRPPPPDEWIRIVRLHFLIIPLYFNFHRSAYEKPSVGTDFSNMQAVFDI